MQEPQIQKKICMKKQEFEEQEYEPEPEDVKQESFEAKKEEDDQKKKIQTKAEEKIEDGVSFSSALSDDANWEVDLL